MKSYYKNIQSFRKNVRKFQEGGTVPTEETTAPATESEAPEPTTNQDPMQMLQDALKRALESNNEDCEAAFEVVNLLNEIMTKQAEQAASQMEAPSEGVTPAGRYGMKNQYMQEGDEFEMGEEEEDALTEEELMDFMEMSEEEQDEAMMNNPDLFMQDEKGNIFVNLEGHGPVSLDEVAKSLDQEQEKAMRGMRMQPAPAPQMGSDFMRKVMSRNSR